METPAFQAILDALVSPPAESGNSKGPGVSMPPPRADGRSAAVAAAGDGDAAAGDPDDADPDRRPSHSYMELIVMALGSMPRQQGNLHEIYSFITARFPFYTKNRKHWKNSVRHNLTLHKCFRRLDNSKGGGPETGGEADRLPLDGGKKPARPCPLWELLWRPAERPGGGASRKRRPNQSSQATKKSKKAKVPAPAPAATEGTATESAATESAQSAPRPQAPPARQGLYQSPLTPESDYESLFSEHSPSMPGPAHSVSSTTSSTSSSISEGPSSTFEYPPPAQQHPSPRQLHQYTPELPLLSVEDICSVLQCDDCPPDSPDSGTGVDLLDGFGIFNPVPHSLPSGHRRHYEAAGSHGPSRPHSQPQHHQQRGQHQQAPSDCPPRKHCDIPPVSFVMPARFNNMAGHLQQQQQSRDTEFSW